MHNSNLKLHLIVLYFQKTDKLEAWHRRLQEIIFRPHPDFDTFLKVICEEWIFIKTTLRKTEAEDIRGHQEDNVGQGGED